MPLLTFDDLQREIEMETLRSHKQSFAEFGKSELSQFETSSQPRKAYSPDLKDISPPKASAEHMDLVPDFALASSSLSAAHTRPALARDETPPAEGRAAPQSPSGGAALHISSPPCAEPTLPTSPPTAQHQHSAPTQTQQEGGWEVQPSACSRDPDPPPSSPPPGSPPWAVAAFESSSPPALRVDDLRAASPRSGGGGAEAGELGAEAPPADGGAARPATATRTLPLPKPAATAAVAAAAALVYIPAESLVPPSSFDDLRRMLELELEMYDGGVSSSLSLSVSPLSLSLALNLSVSLSLCLSVS
jgi:hypothetical protein